ncbi:hypothetical protein RRG08_052379 [Elysia crispata]|uniref:Uncharacterized protein n=1 Tax=Elysia crispata TaxID=231223 RepID=A0AAE1DTU3_9GAST|nr:hypothetical protein RRG08_052379 [Elysia crispata]
MGARGWSWQDDHLLRAVRVCFSPPLGALGDHDPAPSPAKSLIIPNICDSPTKWPLTRGKMPADPGHVHLYVCRSILAQDSSRMKRPVYGSGLMVSFWRPSPIFSPSHWNVWPPARVYVHGVLVYGGRHLLLVVAVPLVAGNKEPKFSAISLFIKVYSPQTLQNLGAHVGWPLSDQRISSNMSSHEGRSVALLTPIGHSD